MNLTERARFFCTFRFLPQVHNPMKWRFDRWQWEVQSVCKVLDAKFKKVLLAREKTAQYRYYDRYLAALRLAKKFFPYDNDEENRRKFQTIMGR